MIDNNKLKQLVLKQEQYMINTRRYFHENPEVSSKEFETSEYLKRKMKSLNMEIKAVEGTGFYAILDTGRPGKTIGLRTDIDALPMQEHENNLKQAKKCVSKRDGAMHACGHDGHMAVVLAAAKILSDLKEQLNGKIIFIFEEGEEIGAGIDAMIHALRDYHIDAIYGTHLAAFMDTGDVCVDAGPVMAGSVLLEFDVFGRGGHGSRPDLAINPIFGVANILTGLASAWANQVDVSKTVTLGIANVHAGTAWNIIPDSAYVAGSLRYFDVEEGKRAFEIFKNVTHKTADAHNCTVSFRDSTKVATVPVINDKELAALAQEEIKSIYPQKLKHDVVWYASESFSKYSELAPTLFAFVGIRNKQYGSGADHHNEHFDMDEDALHYSLMYTLKFMLKVLND